MKTQEILSIVALGLLGVCLLCGLAKMAMKGPKAKQTCNHACSLSFFAAVVLLGVSQLITEEGYGTGSGHCTTFTIKDPIKSCYGGIPVPGIPWTANPPKDPPCPNTNPLHGDSREGLCESDPSNCIQGRPLGSTECNDSSMCTGAGTKDATVCSNIWD